MMESTCSQVIQILDKMSFPDPLTVIQCGLKFDHPPWVRQGYGELVMRRHPLSVEEAELLGSENAVRCAAARETYQTDKGSSMSEFFSSSYFSAFCLRVCSVLALQTSTGLWTSGSRE